MSDLFLRNWLRYTATDAHPREVGNRMMISGEAVIPMTESDIASLRRMHAALTAAYKKLPKPHPGDPDEMFWPLHQIRVETSAIIATLDAILEWRP